MEDTERRPSLLHDLGTLLLVVVGVLVAATLSTALALAGAPRPRVEDRAAFASWGD